MALMSGKVYSNTGAPNNADGVNGDIYMQLDGFKTTYRKEGGAWVAVGSTLGAIPEFVSGVGAPSNSLGTDGQYYRNTANQGIYYKQGATWNIIGNLDNNSISADLEQAGIGKDLATPPNFINSGSLNTVIESGEYAYTNAVTNTPTPYGLIKVWRENASVIYQLVQSAGNGGRLYNRYSGDGGATWGSWVSYASTDLATTTLAGIVEKATQAEMNAGTADVWPDAATILNGFSLTSNTLILPEFMGSKTFKWGQVVLPDNTGTDDLITVTFPQPFPDSLDVVLITTGNTLGSSRNRFILHLASQNTSGFTAWYTELENVTQAGFINWFAIGK